MADLGEDFAGVDDLDLNWSLVSGRLALAQAIACRWLEQFGGLFYDPTYGGSLRELIGRSGAPTSAAQLEDQALQDERVESCDVEFVFDETTGQLSVHGVIDDGDGPFGFVIDPATMALQLDSETE